MAFIRFEPVQVRVRTDWFNGRPREITWGDETLQITHPRQSEKRLLPTRSSLGRERCSRSRRRERDSR